MPVFACGAQGIEGVRGGGCVLLVCTMIGDGGLVGLGGEFDRGVGAEDGVASLLVAAFD